MVFVATQTASEQTLLVNSWQSISHARGVSVTGGMHALALAFKPRLQDRFSARLCINQQSHGFLYASGEVRRLAKARLVP
jgi:hypothetical protein